MVVRRCYWRLPAIIYTAVQYQATASSFGHEGLQQSRTEAEECLGTQVHDVLPDEKARQTNLVDQEHDVLGVQLDLMCCALR